MKPTDKDPSGAPPSNLDSNRAQFIFIAVGLAIVLGGITEAKLRQSLQWSDGNFGIFFNPFYDRTGQGETFWIAPIIAWIAVILLLLPLFSVIKRKFLAGRQKPSHWQG